MTKEQQEAIHEGIDRVMKAAVELHDTVEKAAEEAKKSPFCESYGVDEMNNIFNPRVRENLYKLGFEQMRQERDDAREKVARLQEENEQLMRSRNKLMDRIMKMLEEQR